MDLKALFAENRKFICETFRASPSPYFPLSAPLLKGRLRDAHSGS